MIFYRRFVYDRVILLRQIADDLRDFFNRWLLDGTVTVYNVQSDSSSLPLFRHCCIDEMNGLGESSYVVKSGRRLYRYNSKDRQGA